MYHPPRLLSDVEPTRAAIKARVAVGGRFGWGFTEDDLRGRRVVRYFERRRGPSKLIFSI